MSALALVAAVLVPVISDADAAYADPPPSSISLVADQTVFEAGEVVHLTATTDVAVEGSSSVITIVDETTETEVASCDTGTVCETDVAFYTGGEHTYVAHVGSLDSTEVDISRAPWAITLVAADETVDAGDTTLLTATANQDVGETDDEYQISIFDMTSGERLAVCSTGSVCTGDTEPFYIDDATSHQLMAAVTATGSPSSLTEAEDVQAVSDPVSVERAPWEVDVEVDPTSAVLGDLVTATVTVNQDIGETNAKYAIYVFNQDQLLGKCVDGTDCSQELTWRAGTYGINIWAAVGRDGEFTEWGEPEDIQATDSGSVDTPEWELSLTADTTVLAAGETVTLTATANQDVGDTDGNLAIYIVEWVSNTLIKVCPLGTTCTVVDRFNKDTDDPYAGHAYTASISPYVPGADDTGDAWGENIRTASNTINVDQLNWDVSMEMTGTNQFTVEMNQDLGQTNGQFGLFLFSNDDYSIQDSCVSGTRCILTSGTGSSTGFFAGVIRRNDPETYDDIVDWLGGDGVTWSPPTLSFGPVIGPVNRYEAVGGKNMAQKGSGCQCSHADPVNAFSGEFYDTVTDVSIAGAGPVFAVTRSYSTKLAGVDGPFGYGWSASFDAKLRFVLPGNDANPLPRQVEVVQENGSRVLFTRGPGASTTYHTLNRASAELSYDSGSSTWTFVRMKTQILTFDAEGVVTEFEDLDGNTVLVASTDGRITGLTASGGREITLTWTGDRITEVADSAGRTSAYAYDTAGDLISVTAVDGSVTQYGYDAGHYITTVTKPGGGTTTNGYDDDHRVITSTDPLGRTTIFEYSGWDNDITTTITTPDGAKTVEVYVNGVLASQTRAADTPLAATTTFEYDGALNLASLTDPEGGVTSYTYDSVGNVLTKTDPLGQTTTMTYDEFRNPTSTSDPLDREATADFDGEGHLIETVSPAGREQHWTYNANGTIATFTDSVGETTTYTYDAAGRLESTTDPDGRLTTIDYDDAGLAVATTTPDGGTATIDFDDAGRMVALTDPDDNTSTYAYDVDGNLTSETDPNGHSTVKTYDLAGQLLTVTDAEGGVTTFTYTLAGDIATVTDPNGNVVTNVYDLRRQLVSTTDPIGRVTSFTYDLAGRQLTTTQPSTAVSSAVYDLAGRVTSSTDQNGDTTEYEYDDAGQLISVTDPLERVVTTEYTDDGQTATVTLADESTQLYSYDDAGRLESFTNGDGKETTYQYSDSGLPIGKTDPGGLETTLDYDAGGRLETLTRPDNSTIDYRHDDVGRLDEIDYSDPGTVDVTVDYDDAGRLVGMTDASGTTTFTYDDVGNVLSETDGDGATVSYTYDSAGRLTSIGYPGGDTVDYGFDDAGQMTSLTDWLDETTTFTWTPDGQLATQTAPNGVVGTWTYDPVGRTASVGYVEGVTELADFGYSYDEGGQLIGGTISNAGDVVEEYDYDEITQLSSVTRTPSGGSPQTSSPDATSAGQLTITVAGDELSYNAAQQLTELDPVTGPSTLFDFDDNGSRVSEVVQAGGGNPALTTEYVYTAAGSLAEVTTPTTVVEYESDVRGLRQSRTEGATTDEFVWSTAGGLPLLLDDGTHRYIYGPTLSPIAQVDKVSGDFEYLHADMLGTPRLITSDAGAAIGTITVDAFGNRTGHTGSADSAIGFTGNWTDADTGLVYLRARDYDPSTGQFLTVDPLVDQTRYPYAYVANNPLLFTDPTGLDFWGDFGNNLLALGAGLLNGITGGASSLIMSAVIPGYDCFIQKNSAFYTVGDVIGTVAGAVIVTLATAGAGAGLAVAAVAARVIIKAAATTVITVAKAAVSVVTRAASRVATWVGVRSGERSAVATVAKVVDDLPTVNWGQQLKHLPGHPSYVPGRSQLTANPEALVQRAGTGTPIGSSARGEAGFRERIDFGNTIGTYLPRDGSSSPTSIGILHYRIDGSVHIVPGRPR